MKRINNPSPRQVSEIKTVKMSKNHGEDENIVIIDVDSDDFKFNNADIPENPANKQQASKRSKVDKNFLVKTYIYIDDDDDDNISPVNLSKSKRTYPRKGPNNTKNAPVEGSESSQTMVKKSSGKLQKLWEKASSKKKTKIPNDQCGKMENNTALAIVEESDEYKRALKVEKRKEAEKLRLLDMKRRQKQRVEEIRETQKKNLQNMKMKEKYRTEVQQKLQKLEMTCHDMASLLRGLGILANNDPYPSPHQIRAAYKRALLMFHPDRASGCDMRQQVEAEEKFKIISRMKDKIL